MFDKSAFKNKIWRDFYTRAVMAFGLDKIALHIAVVIEHRIVYHNSHNFIKCQLNYNSIVHHGLISY